MNRSLTAVLLLLSAVCASAQVAAGIGVGIGVGRARVVPTSPYGRYSNGGYGNVYGGGYGGVIAPASPTNICPPGFSPGMGVVSLKFDLDLVPKEQRAAVKRGIIVLDHSEESPIGRHDSWFNGGVQVGGCMDHHILITLEDDRTFEADITVPFRGTKVIYPRFKPRDPGTATPLAMASPSTDKTPPLNRPVLVERPRDENGEPLVGDDPDPSGK